MKEWLLEILDDTDRHGRNRYKVRDESGDWYAADEHIEVTGYGKETRIAVQPWELEDIIKLWDNPTSWRRHFTSRYRIRNVITEEIIPCAIL